MATFRKYLIYILLYIVTIGIILSVFLLTPRGDENDFLVVRLVIIMFATVLLVKYFIYMFISPWHDVIVAYKKFRKRNRRTYREYTPESQSWYRRGTRRSVSSRRSTP